MKKLHHHSFPDLLVGNTVKKKKKKKKLRHMLKAVQRLWHYIRKNVLFEELVTSWLHQVPLLWCKTCNLKIGSYLFAKHPAEIDPTKVITS